MDRMTVVDLAGCRQAPDRSLNTKPKRGYLGGAVLCAVGSPALVRSEEPSSLGSFDMTLAVVLMGVVLLCLVIVAAELLVLARQRRQIADLMARLDTVEATEMAAVAGDTKEDSLTTQVASPDDVLRGRTTYVQAMIEGADSGSMTLADRTILAVHSGLEGPITSRQLAADLNVSLRTLERVLSATLGCTPRQLIVTMKMREAHRLLLTGKYLVSEVAYRLGFSSPAHFSTRFRRFYQFSPSRLIRRSSVPRSAADDPPGPGVTSSGDAG